MAGYLIGLVCIMVVYHSMSASAGNGCENMINNEDKASACYDEDTAKYCKDVCKRYFKKERENCPFGNMRGTYKCSTQITSANCENMCKDKGRMKEVGINCCGSCWKVCKTSPKRTSKIASQYSILLS